MAKVDLSAEGVCANLDAIAIFDEMSRRVGQGISFLQCVPLFCVMEDRC